MTKAKNIKISRNEALAQVSKMYETFKSEGLDLRFKSQFEFLKDENPRITKKTELDLRYIPTRIKADGRIDKRYKKV